MPLSATWTDLEIIILTELSQEEKDKYYTTSLTCKNLKYDTNKPIYKTETVTDIHNRLVVIKRERKWGRDWAYGINRYKLLYRE